ncbi:hypothetical protein BOX15_Mlig021140g2 [Macrostomum lignano]|uniref:Uncharacterized protein n=2 Tax=Macrostomum lignano TaxID=282301 RepID=A0A267G6X0_9PLAT|nr:hypothetical protein BOX15_Mlig021140g3 [Macrostomum lignano]PAA82424.1 hypothetical protein BOX15_Mlig021140g2 [Macrostomum lignano]
MTLRIFCLQVLLVSLVALSMMAPSHCSSVDELEEDQSGIRLIRPRHASLDKLERSLYRLLLTSPEHRQQGGAATAAAAKQLAAALAAEEPGEDVVRIRFG